MKNRTTILNAILAAVLGVVLLASVIAKMLCPQIILPEMNIPYMVAISLTALVLTHFVKTEEGCPVCQAALAAITFSVLPWAAGLATIAVWQLALCGGTVFAILNAMFTAVEKRMELMDVNRYAVVPAAFGLYLACQCFAGWIL